MASAGEDAAGGRRGCWPTLIELHEFATLVHDTDCLSASCEKKSCCSEKPMPLDHSMIAKIRENQRLRNI